MEKMIFSKELREAALKEVREAYRKKMKLKQKHRELYFELENVKDEIRKLEDGITGTVTAFGFELRAVRDAEGKIKPDPDYEQEFNRDYFFEEDEE